MKKNIFICTALATMALSACSNNDNDPVVDTLKDTPIVINAGVNDLTTRAGYADDNLPTEIGLYITNPSNAAYTYKNYKMTYANNQWTTTDGTMMWQNATQTVSVVAYTPYNGTKNDELTDKAELSVSVQANQSTTDGLAVATSDFLYYKKDAVTPSTDGISLPMEHIFSKLLISFTHGSELNGKTVVIKNVTVSGMQTTHKFNLSTGALVTGGLSGDAVDIVMYLQDGTAPIVKTAEAILVPQTVAITVTIAATVDTEEKTFSYTADLQEFATKTQYTLALAVGRDGVQTGTFDINPWGKPVEGGNLETTENK